MAEAHARRLNASANTHLADAIDGSGAAVLQALFLGEFRPDRRELVLCFPHVAVVLA